MIIVDKRVVINLTVLKVESVKIHPLYQVAQRLRLKRGQPRVADLTEEAKYFTLNYAFEHKPNTNHKQKRRLTHMPQSLRCSLPLSAAQ